ncbi:MFS transporter [Aquincola agrisoli]|uniref:MFS transporter n=1 Tax=Aquincola sp. GCM10022187 TaxID=3252634 RepID=UPI00366BB80D
MAEAPPPRRAFRLIALALLVGNMGATMISPLLPIYRLQWGLAASTITVVFVAYMLGVLSAFLFLGRVSDHAGPLKVLKAALLMMVAGLAASAAAPGVEWLVAARAVVGVASGLITASATVGLVEAEPAGAVRRAPLVASVTTMAGFGLGPLVCGLLAQGLPQPLVWPHLLIAAPTAAVLLGLAKVRATGAPPRPASSLRLAPSFVLPAPGARAAFLLASLGLFTAYAVFSMMASLAPTFLDTILPWHGPAVSGLALSAVLFCSSGIQLPMRRRPQAVNARLGLSALAASVACLAGALILPSPLLFFTADLLLGLGHGLTYLASLSRVSGMATPASRAGLLCSFLSIGYLGTIVPILATGLLADHVGVPRAAIVFCCVFAVSTLGLLVWSLRMPGTPAAAQPVPAAR